MNHFNKLFSTVTKALSGYRDYRSSYSRFNRPAASVLHALVVFSLIGTNFGGSMAIQREIQPGSDHHVNQPVQSSRDDDQPDRPALEMPVIPRQTPRIGVRPPIDMNGETPLKPSNSGDKTGSKRSSIQKQVGHVHRERGPIRSGRGVRGTRRPGNRQYFA